MQFNETTNNQGIIQAYELKTSQGLGTVSGTTARLQEATLYANNALDKIWHSIFKTSGSWQFDDSNQADLPQATAQLNSGQSTYALPSTALTVRRVEYKNETGDYFELKPLQLKEIPNGVDEFFEDDAEPRYYRLLNDTMEIFPASNYTVAAGLKIYFDRAAVKFATNDTTQEPGFASPYHYLVPLWMSYEWKSVHIPNEAGVDRNEFEAGLKDLEKMYSTRNKNDVAKITPKKSKFI